MTTTRDATDLEPVPVVPGGGPAGRWRPARFTSRFAWTWLALLLACPVVVGTVAVTSRHQGELTDGGLTALIVVGLVFLVLLCGVHAAGMAAVEGRIDDDMRVYGTGRRSVLRRRPGVAGWNVPAPLEVDSHPAGHLDRGFGPQGEWATLTIGSERWHWRTGPGRYALVPEPPGAAEVAVAVGHARRGGRRVDWEIEVDGRLLRVRVLAGRPLPRRTLLDDRGHAWLVRAGRRSVEGRLPAGLSALGAAFCLMVLDELGNEPAPWGTEYGGDDVSGAWVDDDGPDWSEASWLDGSWSDGSDSWSW